MSATTDPVSSSSERAFLTKGLDSTDLAVCREDATGAQAGPSQLPNGGSDPSSSSSSSASSSTSKCAAASSLMASVASTATEVEPQGPFEGPEKLLELWFADSPELLPRQALRSSFTILQDAKGEAVKGISAPERVGLRAVPRQLWEEMLDLVKCKVLSVIEGQDVDAYLLSESSMFVFPHKIILKTCGTTTLLLGLRRLLELAKCSLTGQSSFRLPETSPDAVCRDLGAMVRQCFYSRKSFMFPERQKGPHKDWMLEVQLLEAFFVDGSAYTVGKMNGDHWLLFMCCPGDEERTSRFSPAIDSAERPLQLPLSASVDVINDQTLEILMTHLSPSSCAAFEFSEDMKLPAQPDSDKPLDRGHLLALDLSEKLGLATLFPNTQLDAFAFDPCGYSANAVIPASSQTTSGYWTIHVTPEADSSYASFESNVALRRASGQVDDDEADTSGKNGSLAPRDLPALIKQVVDIFQPGKMSITLFTSSRRGEESSVTGVDDASLLHSLRLPGYTRRDRIAYEFESYDLVFCHFETISRKAERS